MKTPCINSEWIHADHFLHKVIEIGAEKEVGTAAVHTADGFQKLNEEG